MAMAAPTLLSSAPKLSSLALTSIRGTIFLSQRPLFVHRRFAGWSAAGGVVNSFVDTKYARVGADFNNAWLKEVLVDLQDGSMVAAKKGAEVIMAAVDKPRVIGYKGTTDLVTDTDKLCEQVILAAVKKRFPDHLILGEEGGLTGDPASEFLWCIDPLDGTTNFAHGYPSFGVSVGVLYRGKPIAATVVEFAGGPYCWVTRTFTASAGSGSYCNGEKIHVSATDEVEKSLLVTGFGYEHDEAWATNCVFFKEFTDISRGVRRLGAAAVDMCHVALGIVDAYWEYRLKPWDMAAGVLMVEEAGGKVTCMDGGDFCVFNQSVLVSNGFIHDKLLQRIAPPSKKLVEDGLDFSLWFKPSGYTSDV
eukprot:c25071_g1_i1 orf=411-1496(-)